MRYAPVSVNVKESSAYNPKPVVNAYMLECKIRKFLEKSLPEVMGKITNGNEIKKTERDFDNALSKAYSLNASQLQTAVYVSESEGITGLLKYLLNPKTK